MTIQSPACEHEPKHAAVINVIQRYGLITPAAIVALKPGLFPNKAAAGRLLRRLARDGVVREGVLYPGHAYYDALGQYLSETSKIRAYAMLTVCAAPSGRRTRLTRADFQQHFPELWRPGLPMNYYIDSSRENPLLGYLRVDQGGRGRWDRVVAKALSDARKHRLEPAFDRFLKRKAFEIRIVTALAHKADRIRRELMNHPHSSELPIQISIVPELINLIAPLPSETPASQTPSA